MLRLPLCLGSCGVSEWILVNGCAWGEEVDSSGGLVGGGVSKWILLCGCAYCGCPRASKAAP